MNVSTKSRRTTGAVAVAVAGDVDDAWLVALPQGGQQQLGEEEVPDVVRREMLLDAVRRLLERESPRASRVDQQVDARVVREDLRRAVPDGLDGAEIQAVHSHGDVRIDGMDGVDHRHVLRRATAHHQQRGGVPASERRDGRGANTMRCRSSYEDCLILSDRVGG